MKRIFNYFFMALSFLMIACTSEYKQPIYRNVKTLLSDTLNVPSYSLLGDTICNDALWPTDILVIDTFMLVAQHKDEHLIHVYSLKDTTKLGKFLQKGGGPNDVNLWNGFTQYWKESGEVKLLIQSYPQYIGVLNLNQTLKQNKVVFEERFSFRSDSAMSISARSNVSYKIGNRFLMSRAPERIVGLKDFNASYQWFDFETDAPGDIIYAMDQPLFPIPFLYATGGACYSPQKGKICYTCRFMNLFFLLDVHTGNSVQIVPNNKSTDLETFVSEQKDASFFADVAYTENYLYLLTYNGVSYQERKDTDACVEVYDWEGNHVCRFILSDYIYYITVDESDKILYAVLHDGGIKKYQLSQGKVINEYF